MSVCSPCARLADPDETRHHESVTSLLESSQSCPLCQYFLSHLAEEKVNKIQDHANQGQWTRSMFKKQPVEWLRGFNTRGDEMNETLNQGHVGFRKFFLLSATAQLEGKPIFLASSNGMS
jgi:hypothetical protein